MAKNEVRLDDKVIGTVEPSSKRWARGWRPTLADGSALEDERTKADAIHAVTAFATSPLRRLAEREPLPKPATPVLDAMLKVADDSGKIGQFLDWMANQGIVLARFDPRIKAEVSEQAWAAGDDPERNEDEVIADAGDPVAVYIPIHEGPSALLHRYFKIDANEEERERRALLDWALDPYLQEMGNR